MNPSKRHVKQLVEWNFLFLNGWMHFTLTALRFRNNPALGAAPV